MLRDGMVPAPASSADVRPRVLVPVCNRMLGEVCSHVAASKYVDAVLLAGCQPLIVPSVHASDDEALLAVAQGVLLTGSPSNVHPGHYAENALDESLRLDPARDAWILPLIPKILALAMPLFAICRGFQEANAPGFSLALQWHPEWHAAENPVSMRLLGAFGDAARSYRQRGARRHSAADEARHAPA